MERSEINQRMEERVRPYIDLVDQLRNIGVNQDIPLPQVRLFFHLFHLFWGKDDLFFLLKSPVFLLPFFSVFFLRLRLWAIKVLAKVVY